MDKQELRTLWAETLRAPGIESLDRVALAMVDLYRSGDAGFRQHIRNRLGRDGFDHSAARDFIADELGLAGWADLVLTIEAGCDDPPLLFQYTLAAMRRGDFTSLEESIGEDRFYDTIVGWHQAGAFQDEQETVDEVLSAACMLGQTPTAEYLIDQGVDPYAGMRTWLAGPHYAVSGGRLETLKMLLTKGIDLEVENGYGGTLLGQAFHSAINEHSDQHAEIIELLIDAGAHVWPGTLEWWLEQSVPSETTKARVAEALAHRQ